MTSKKKTYSDVPSMTHWNLTSILSLELFTTVAGMGAGSLTVTWVAVGLAHGLQELPTVLGGEMGGFAFKLTNGDNFSCTINSDQEFWVSHYQTNDFANNYME